MNILFRIALGQLLAILQSVHFLTLRDTPNFPYFTLFAGNALIFFFTFLFKLMTGEMHTPRVSCDIILCSASGVLADFIFFLVVIHKISFVNFNILSAFLLPTTLVFTYIILKTDIHFNHLFGVYIAIGGIFMSLLDDASTTKFLELDALLLSAVVLRAYQNVITKKLFLAADIEDVLYNTSFFRLIFSAIPFMIYSKHSISNLEYEQVLLSIFIIYNCSIFCYLFYEDTVFLTMSCLTSASWGFIFSIFFFHEDFDFIKMTIFLVIFISLLMYGMY
jgi:hypothetical protein